MNFGQIRAQSAWPSLSATENSLAAHQLADLRLKQFLIYRFWSTELLGFGELKLPLQQIQKMGQ